MHPLHILSSVLLYSSLAAAWSWVDGGLSDQFDLELYRRDAQAVTLGDSNAATPNPSEPMTTAPSSKSVASQASNTGTTASGSTSGSQPSGSASDASKTTSGSQKASSTALPSFSANLPPGGVSMVEPNTASSSMYYKIGNYVTFAWNFTSLSVTPTAVDVLATCTANQHTYTLALNQTVPANGTGAVTWDTNGYQATATVPLLTETYTLIIYDAAKSMSASPSPGYLDTFDTFSFAMYTPQPYVNMSEYTCVTCSGAMSTMERQSMAVVGLAAAFAVGGATLLMF